MSYTTLRPPHLTGLLTVAASYNQHSDRACDPLPQSPICCKRNTCSTLTWHHPACNKLRTSPKQHLLASPFQVESMTNLKYHTCSKLATPIRTPTDSTTDKNKNKNMNNSFGLRGGLFIIQLYKVWFGSVV